ncbi:hypothetical protein [Dactylosporangium matsuzakiense]|uniref:Nucleic acid-binding protein n=1 Tax=Dactylosporangium matsuzakiense TaxID=53360 RepID=A0A9W6NQL5_9ACTN|nr:hypothetical protein [Dactylosporangium matsuzakiense]UWZ44599.1 hypothetical protein Dmats_45905 [Dactylosporangium matsuzakiense]GLL05366.1 hypothetical protein GCM10017581_071130 [Dactylosporangium matsuzakiense]
MTADARPSLFFDSMCLSGFSGADRLDVLRDLLVDRDCWTTAVVRSELDDGAGKHPHLRQALAIDWMQIATLDALDDLRTFVKWAERLGSGQHGLGEASVLAAAELRGGVAITDDRDAVKVARKHRAEVHGTIWLLAELCKDGKLNEGTAGGLIDALRAEGMRLPCSGAQFPGFARQNGLL